MPLVLLENVRSILNVGGIFRIADAVGVKKILLVGYTPAPIDRMGRKNAKITKTALGAEELVPWQHYPTTQEALRDNPGHTPIAVEQTPTAVPYTEHTTKHPLYIFGNETEGIQEKTLQTITTHILLPMHGSKESLNITAATAVILYHHINTPIKH